MEYKNKHLFPPQAKRVGDRGGGGAALLREKNVQEKCGKNTKKKNPDRDHGKEPERYLQGSVEKMGRELLQPRSS